MANTEIEIKFRVDDDALFDDVRALDALAGYTLRAAAASQNQANTYFDTPDWALRERKVALRVRKVGKRRIGTVKTAAANSDGVTTRGEWEVELDGDDAPRSWPASAARDAALAALGDADVVPLLRIATRRWPIEVLWQGQALAEIALDDSLIDAGGLEASLRELEIELHPDADRAAFDGFVAAMRERYVLPVELRSKLERGMLLLEQSARPSLELVAVAAALADHRWRGRGRSALLHAAQTLVLARAAGREKPGRAARDAILADATLAPKVRRLAAAAAALQRSKVRPQREPAMIALGQRSALLASEIAAALQLADALADARAPLEASSDDGELTIALGGMITGDLASAAERWRADIGPLTIQPFASVETAQVAPDDAPDGSPLLPASVAADEPAAEGLRRGLRRMFEKLLSREDGVLASEDREEVHQMRVATRRLRASLQLAEGVFAPDAVLRYRRGLRDLARTLGEVRDLDVFLGAIEAFGEALPPDEAGAMVPLTERVRAAHPPLRQRLLDYLQSGGYRRFKREFASFLTTYGADALPDLTAPAPPRLRDLAGSLIWWRYERWRAYEVLVERDDVSDVALHEMRIAGKQLRYTLELFDDLLTGVAPLLEKLAALQETLGAVQDGVVAQAALAALGMDADAGAQRYLAALTARHDAARTALPAAWAEVATAAQRRKLLSAIGAL